MKFWKCQVFKLFCQVLSKACILFVSFLKFCQDFDKTWQKSWKTWNFQIFKWPHRIRFLIFFQSGKCWWKLRLYTFSARKFQIARKCVQNFGAIWKNNNMYFREFWKSHLRVCGNFQKLCFFASSSKNLQI